jgi:hypothetical protein
VCVRACVRASHPSPCPSKVKGKRNSHQRGGIPLHQRAIPPERILYYNQQQDASTHLFCRARVVLSCPVGYTETSKESHDGIGLDYRLSDHNPNPNKRRGGFVCDCSLLLSVRAATSLVLLRAPKTNYPRPISFAEGRSVMPPWLYRDF